jgi:putative inorganic carbon (hco3(-)) transporter
MLKTYNVRERSKTPRTATFFERVFLDQKLENKTGYVIFGLIAIAFGYLLSTQTLAGLEIFGGVLGAFVVLACFLSAEAGLVITMIFSFFGFFLNRLLFNDEFPIGVVSDVLIASTFIGMMISRGDFKNNFKELTHNGIFVFIIFYALYLLVQLFNPNANSFEGWFQTFRRFIICIFLLVIAYNIFTSQAAIKRYVKVFFVIAFLSGLYGCIQQWHGYFQYELDLIYRAENVYYINGGELRKIGTMSDPLSYGVVMATSAIFFLIIAPFQKPLARTVILFGVIFMLLGMAYSGTRTANVMVIVGIGMFVLLTFHKKVTRLFAFGGALVFLFLLYAPIYGNGTINRFRTSFIGKEDASFNVREVNRHIIQPYIHSHPIGGGLCTSGEPGRRFNPGHELAGFPPDSGYLRKALETGWIGLLMIVVLYFITLQFGIRGYFRTHHEKRRVLYVACISCLFALYIAEFPQEAIGQITDMVLYYPFIAILIKLRQMDKDEEKIFEKPIDINAPSLDFK